MVQQGFQTPTTNPTTAARNPPPQGSTASPSNTPIKNKEDTGHLQLNYYNSGNPTPLKRYIFFIMKSVDIKESRSAKYVEYLPLSRSSQLFSYTGSTSRVFDISFSYGKQDLESIDLARLSRTNNSPQSVPASNKFFPDLDVAGIDPTGRPFGLLKYTSNADPVSNFIDNQIQLIRSMTLNHAKTPTQGPPLVRLNYGLLYQDVPCICTDYTINQQNTDSSIKVDPATKLFMGAGEIQVSLTLKELRTGDYLKTDFAQAVNLSRDNLVGWEQIFNQQTGSFDPVSPVFN